MKFYILIILFVITSCDVPQRNRFIEVPTFNSTPQDNTTLNKDTTATPVNTNNSSTNDLPTSSSTNLNNSCNLTPITPYVSQLGPFEYCKDTVDQNRFRFRFANNPTNIYNQSGVCFAPLHNDSRSFYLVGNVECTNYMANQSYGGNYTLTYNLPHNAFIVFHQVALNTFLACFRTGDYNACNSFNNNYFNYFKIYYY